MEGGLINTRQAADILGCTQRHVVRYISIGVLRAVDRVWDDGPYLVDREAVEALARKPSSERMKV